MNMTVLGFLFTVEWFNPYTQPPEGKPRYLGGSYLRTEPGQGCPPTPKSIAALLVIGNGYTLYATALTTPIKHWSEERKLKNRKQRLRRRIEKKWPLLAEQMIADEMAKRGWTE